MKPRIALATAACAQPLDDDLPPLIEAFAGAAKPVPWDDPAISWSDFDLVLIRSTWDYVPRHSAFLDWTERVAATTRLFNPPALVRWNTDKHYLADLDSWGIAIVPTRFFEPGREAPAELATWVEELGYPQFVVKPAVGAGSKDARRYRREQIGDAIVHAETLLMRGRSVLVQPYFERVDNEGETALIFIDGTFSHAVRKGPLLRLDEGPTEGLFAPETITPRQPSADELALAKRIVAAIPGGAPLYARVDLLRDTDGSPCLLELELTEPSLFFAHGQDSAQRYAEAALRRLTKWPGAP